MALNASGDANQPHYVGVDVTEKGASMEPNARRIIEVYQPLMSFVAEIEAALVCAPGSVSWDVLQEFTNGSVVSR